jgi:DNA primase
MRPARGQSQGWVDFRAVKEAVSMEAVLRYYQVPSLRRQHGQRQGRCPIHRGERDDSFRASLSKNAFQCFACQAQGNVMDFVAAMEKCSIREAALKLQQWFGIGEPGSPAGVLPRSAGTEGKLVREKEGFNPPLRFALTGLEHTHSYVAQRGIDRATAVEFGIGFYGGPGLMSGRVVIPIHNRQGETVAYAGRAADGRTPKYKLPGGFHKAMELYNLHRAIASGNKTVIVVEGYFDCLRVHQAGLPWVVALMGASLSPQQERLLTERFEQVILMLDGDAAGRAATRAISATLLQKCEVIAVAVGDGTQPDQLSPAEVRSLFFAAAQRLCQGRPTTRKEGANAVTEPRQMIQTNY